jgi:hypothetical protein
LFIRDLNGNRHVVAFGGKTPKGTLSAFGKGSEHKLLAPITSNRNGCESIKKLEIVVASNVVTLGVVKV